MDEAGVLDNLDTYIYKYAQGWWKEFGLTVLSIEDAEWPFFLQGIQFLEEESRRG
jgi:hypothetical protein